MTNEIQQNANLLTEWCMQFTDEFINDKVTPIINELLNDKGFMTLLKKWKLEKEWYDRFRKDNIASYFESKIDLPKLSKELKLESYKNSVFDYNLSLQTIVMNWLVKED